MGKQAEERQKGIAATALAIGGLVVLTAVAVITSVVLQKNRQTQRSRAEIICESAGEGCGVPTPTFPKCGEIGGSCFKWDCPAGYEQKKAHCWLIDSVCCVPKRSPSKPASTPVFTPTPTPGPCPAAIGRCEPESPGCPSGTVKDNNYRCPVNPNEEKKVCCVQERFCSLSKIGNACGNFVKVPTYECGAVQNRFEAEPEIRIKSNSCDLSSQKGEEVELHIGVKAHGKTMGEDANVGFIDWFEIDWGDGYKEKINVEGENYWKKKDYWTSVINSAGGGSTPVYSEEKDVVVRHTYNSPGTYTVKIASVHPNVTNSGGYYFWIRGDYIYYNITSTKITVNSDSTSTSTPSDNQIQDNQPPKPPKKDEEPELISGNDGKKYIRFTWKWAGDNPENGVGYCKAYRDDNGNVIKYASSRYENIACKPDKNSASPFWWQIVIERINGESVTLYKCYDNKIQVYNNGEYSRGGEGCGYMIRFDVPLESVNSFDQVRGVRIDLRARDAFGNIRNWREEGAVTVIRYNFGQTCAKDKGDANCDGKVDIADYSIWLGEFRNGCSSNNNNEESCLGDADGDGNLMDADFYKKDDKVGIKDYYVWYQSYASLTPTPR